MRPWEIAVNRRPPTAPLSQRRFLGEPCNTPVHLRRSPPVRRQWGQQDRRLLHNSLHQFSSQDENFHHSIFSQHQQQVSLDESRQYNHTSAPPRMLRPVAHPPQQNSIMVDLHEQMHQGSVPISYTVTTVTTHGFPIHTGQPIPACNTQQLPACSLIQACTMQHLPVSYQAFPPLISSEHFILHPTPPVPPHQPPHLAPLSQFVPLQPQHPRMVGPRVVSPTLSQVVARTLSALLHLKCTKCCAVISYVQLCISVILRCFSVLVIPTLLLLSLIQDVSQKA